MRRALRVYFRANGVDRHFCWFEQQDDELYFGPASSRSTFPAISFSGSDVTITVPSDLDALVEGPMKASHHASGQFHVKIGDAQAHSKMVWPKKGELLAPFRLAAVLSRHPIYYPAYTRSLTRKRSDALVIRTAPPNACRRQYLEFFLTPPATFAAPAPMLAFTGFAGDQPVASYSMSDEVILVIRSLTVGGQLSEWQPEQELWLFTDPTKSEALADHETR